MAPNNENNNHDIECGSVDYDEPNISGSFKNEPFEPNRCDASWYDYFHSRTRLLRNMSLMTNKNACKASLHQLRFAVLCAAINSKMLNPSYPLMVGKDHPDAFPSTEPFDFNSATYFIPMCSLLGVAIASIFAGKISDHIGRKRVILLLSIISGIGSIVKYFTRKTFWGFSIANFIFGFFLGNLPVAMAYVGDIYTTKKDKEKELGTLISCYVIGNSGGGIIAILMGKSGLFAPLWVGAGLMFLSAITTSLFMVDPDDERIQVIGNETISNHEEIERPKQINKRILWNIVVGSLADNFGSTALFPLCLSPLALEHYTLDFLHAGAAPIMTIEGFQWLSVCVAFMVVPSTVITPNVFAKIGIAGTCVLGNVLTALVTLILLLIGNMSATSGAFAGFVTALYLGLPFTVLSQLSTAPMLDMIAPEDKIGYVQGLKASAMNFGMAFSPWLFGLLADRVGTNTTIWIGIGISLLAALVNVPLMWYKGYGPMKKIGPLSIRVLPGEDEELIKKILDGEYIPPKHVSSINRQRIINGKPMLVPRVKRYEDEKDAIGDLRSHAVDTFQFQMENYDNILSQLSNQGLENELPEVPELCRLYNTAISGDEKLINEINYGLGQWFSDYLTDNGYHPHVQSLLIKQMILSAFPPFTQDKEYTPANLKPILVRRRQVMNQYVEVNKKEDVLEEL